MSFLNTLKADLIKIKMQPIVWAHIIVPIAASLVFLAYFGFTNWDTGSQFCGFFELIGCCFPVLIGIFSANIAEQEQNAGAFQNMLSARSKTVSFLSKLVMILLMGLGSVMGASLLFGLGSRFVISNHDFTILQYLSIGLLVFACGIPLYAWHLFLAFKAGKGVTMGLGVVDSLISALFLTGIGDRLWLFTPFSWTARVPSAFAQNMVLADGVQTGLKTWYLIYGIILVVSAAGYLFWSSRWEGGRAAE